MYLGGQKGTLKHDRYFLLALSELLNKLPIHSERLDFGKFRNPRGVYMKLCRILRFDPEYKCVGPAPGGKLEKEIWNECAGDQAMLRTVAGAIRSAMVPQTEWALTAEEVSLDEEASKGTILTRLHRIKERNQKLVRAKKKKTLDRYGCLICKVCAFDFTRQYGHIGYGFIECHHTVPIPRLAGGVKTRLSDLALVCANCHRMLHRGPRWLSIDVLRTLLKDTPQPRSDAVDPLKKDQLATIPAT